jgi:hypothetical protein
VHGGAGIIEPTLDMRQKALAGQTKVVERAAFAEVLGIASHSREEGLQPPEVFEKLLRLCL